MNRASSNQASSNQASSNQVRHTCKAFTDKLSNKQEGDWWDNPYTEPTKLTAKAITKILRETKAERKQAELELKLAQAEYAISSVARTEQSSNRAIEQSSNLRIGLSPRKEEPSKLEPINPRKEETNGI